jgi:hypothetical protein
MCAFNFKEKPINILKQSQLESPAGLTSAADWTFEGTANLTTQQNGTKLER